MTMTTETNEGWQVQKPYSDDTRYHYLRDGVALCGAPVTAMCSAVELSGKRDSQDCARCRELRREEQSANG